MAIHLVGETIDRIRAHAAAQAGSLISLWRGIYLDATDDIDTAVIQHAVRIAIYLYPKAYLSGPSASLLAPTADGRLFLSSRRNQRTRIRSLEIIQNEAPENPSTVDVIVGDDMGEMNLTASSPRQRFLESFRRRSEHANSIDQELRTQMAERLIQEYSDPRKAADAVWTLGRSNRWIREAEAAEQFLNRDFRGIQPVNKASFELFAAWHGEIVGTLGHDGAEWRWRPSTKVGPALVRETRPGSLPPFIESLLPEGWLAKVLNEHDERDVLRNGSRYMSNMIVVGDPQEIARLPADILEGRLSNFRDHGMFSGRYMGPARQTLEENFQERLAALFAIESMPRLSGVQIKAPMHLSKTGELHPATTAAFTHILKPAGTNGFEMLPTVEWTCLTLAGLVQFEVPENALVEMPDGMAPALLVERFDIRRTSNDSQRLAMEDFCSVLDLPTARKYDGTIERIARALRPLSTDPQADVEVLFRRALFAWLVADGDMHLKNLALLKVAEAGETRFSSVRFAPVYDVVTTRLFPGLEHDRMALKLNGKDDRLDPDDFLSLARTIDIPQKRALVLMADCARRLVEAAPLVTLPAQLERTGGPMLAEIKKIVADRSERFL